MGGVITKWTSIEQWNVTNNRPTELDVSALRVFLNSSTVLLLKKALKTNASSSAGLLFVTFHCSIEVDFVITHPTPTHPHLDRHTHTERHTVEREDKRHRGSSV